MRRIAILLGLPLLLAHCASDPNPKDSSGTEVAAQREKSNNLADIEIPLLHSPELERRWGKPTVSVYEDGSYRLSYVDPNASFESLSISGGPDRVDTDGPVAPTYSGAYPLPDGRVPEFSQDWKTATVLGKPTHYYQSGSESGADAPEFTTVTFPVELPGKPVASYSLRAASNKENAKKEVEGFFKTAQFR